MANISQINGLQITAQSASVAATASFVGPTLNQNLTLNGNFTVNGTASYTYITASNLNVGTNFISVNVSEPAERFGGLKVYDSGSLSHLATASLAWDSTNNHWVYQNASGSTYTGGMLMAGPRNTGSLGDEPSLTKWFVARSDGGDHLNDTQIYSSASIHIVTGSLRGQVSVLSISSNTASIDMSSNNFFTLALVNGANTHINPTNINPGQTVNIRVTQGSLGTGTVSFPSFVDQPSGSLYTGSAVANAIDIVTMITFDSSIVFVSSVRNMI